jgi:hypothetical protein
MTRFTYKYLVALIAVFSINGIIGGAIAQDLETIETTGGYKVTFLMFSGRPNPTMTVTDKEQIRSISEAFSTSLATVDESAVTPTLAATVLGYNGVLIETIPAKGSSLVRSQALDSEAAALPTGEELHVSKGWVLEPSAQQNRGISSEASPQRNAIAYDRSRKVEKLLVEFAHQQGVIEPEIVELIEQAVNSAD